MPTSQHLVVSTCLTTDCINSICTSGDFLIEEQTVYFIHYIINYNKIWIKSENFMPNIVKHDISKIQQQHKKKLGHQKI